MKREHLLTSIQTGSNHFCWKNFVRLSFAGLVEAHAVSVVANWPEDKQQSRAPLICDLEVDPAFRKIQAQAPHSMVLRVQSSASACLVLKWDFPENTNASVEIG
jgi:hypothetical protein